MTFEQLRTLLAVAEAGSFTRAAQHLYLSQPAVSQHVLALERFLDRKLFDRKGRRLVLTLAGERLVAYAREVVRATDAMRAELAALDDPLQGVVAVGAIHSVGVYLMPQLIAAFHRAHPSVRIELKIGNTEQITDELLRGALDVACLDAVITPSSSRHFRRDDFMSEDGALIVPPDHPWAGRDDVAGAELHGEPVVMRERGARSRAALETELARHEVDLARLRIEMELGSTEAIKQAVASGLGIGFVPACAVKREIAWGALGRATLRTGPFGRQLWLYTPLRHGLAPRIRLFREAVLAAST